MIDGAATRQASLARDGRDRWRGTAVLALGLSLLGVSSASAEPPTTILDTWTAGLDSSIAATDTLAAPAQGSGALVPIDLRLLGTVRPRQRDGQPLSLIYPSFATSYRRSMWREVQGNRFESGLVWADRGAFAGAALGFLGAQAAVTSERTSLLLMGVGAALGALWGGLQPAEDRRLQIRVEPMRWEPAEMLRYDPREREP